MGRLLDGVIAGVCGTVALDTVTYLDMTARGRPASSTPRDSVARLSGLAHVSLGAAETARNRHEGLGSLLGYATGVATAGIYTLAVGRRLPWPAATMVLATAAMLASNLPMTLLGVTDPRRWSRADWLSDVLPHLAYGATAAATLGRRR